MYLLLLLSILILLWSIVIVLCNKDVMEPAALSLESFSLITLIAFCYNGFQKADISIATVFMVTTALCVYLAGYFIAKAVLQIAGVINFSYKKSKVYIPSKIFSFCIFAIEVFAFYRTLNATYSIARSVNPAVNLMNFLEMSRNAYLFTDVSMGGVTSLLSLYTLSVGYFYTYVLIRSCIRSSIFRMRYLIKYKLEISIILLSLVSSMLGTGRTFLIKFLMFSFAMIYYFRVLDSKTMRFSINKMLETIKKMILIIILFFVSFQLMGILTNKTGKSSTLDMLYIYSGAAVVALDRSIDLYEHDGRFFGEESFYGLYGFLNKFGINIPNNILHLPFVSVGLDLKTNIYTSIRTYLYDFGYFGMYLVQFLLGAISAVLYVLLYRMNGQPIFMLVYGILLYGTAMQGIEEITLRNFMSVTNVFLIIYFSILYFITQKKFRIVTRNF